MKDITEVLDILNSFWNNNEATFEEDNDMFFDIDTCNKEDYNKVEDIFWSYLINGNYWNFNNKKILESNGYRCWAGDQDSFGLLVACVTKDKKTFSFG